MDWSETANLIRRFATAIAEGRIEAKEVASMSDEQLKEFRKAKLETLEEKQSEAEQLASENETENLG